MGHMLRERTVGTQGPAELESRPLVYTPSLSGRVVTS